MSQLRGMQVITIPVKMKEQINIVNKTARTMKKKEIVKRSREGDKSIPIITCKRPEFNFYQGQTYEKMSTIPLASQGWNSRHSKGDFFKIHSYGMNPAFLDYHEESHNFESLGLNDEIVENLKILGIHIPTNIQSLAIPHILNGSNTVIAAETGNGKTFAYLAPIIQKILEWKKDNLSSTSLNAPKAIIIVPGRELVIQIRDMARSIGSNLGININSVIGGHTRRMIINPRMSSPDILVASFGALSKLTTHGIYDRKMVKQIILDEADTLLDDSFNEKLVYYLSKFPLKTTKSEDSHVAASTGAQLILAGATFPTSIDSILQQIVETESLVHAKTPLLHRVSPHIEQLFYRVGHDDRSERLLRLAKRLHKDNTPTVIFSNTYQCSEFVSSFLKSYDIPCVNMTGEMKADERANKFRKFQDENCNFLSCTDLASRGLNTVRAEHVINFEFPRFIADFIHRSGRTGRVGNNNKHNVVTNFAFRPYEIDLVQKIEYAIRKSENLPNVNANIKRIIQFRREKYESRQEACNEND